MDGDNQSPFVNYGGHQEDNECTGMTIVFVYFPMMLIIVILILMVYRSLPKSVASDVEVAKSYTKSTILPFLGQSAKEAGVYTKNTIAPAVGRDLNIATDYLGTKLRL